MALIWVIDSCSLIEIKTIPNPIRPNVISHLDMMAVGGSLVYPQQVLGELKGYATPKVLATDIPYQWARKHETAACHPDLLLVEAKAILAAHDDLIVKDGSGKDPADPYVIALAQKLKTVGNDARIVTNDTRQINKKVSVAAVAGLLGIPSTIMRIFLRGQGFIYSA
jgi:hypothetical protein